MLDFVVRSQVHRCVAKATPRDGTACDTLTRPLFFAVLLRPSCGRHERRGGDLTPRTVAECTRGQRLSLPACGSLADVVGGETVSQTITGP